VVLAFIMLVPSLGIAIHVLDSSTSIKKARSDNVPPAMIFLQWLVRMPKSEIKNIAWTGTNDARITWRSSTRLHRILPLPCGSTWMRGIEKYDQSAMHP
jgi:hypothetical protein